MFNIITPTYNREHLIHRVYESLLNQKFNNFIWIIIDDCSTDRTNELVKNWIAENRLAIQYKKLSKNQGKSNAVNFGLDFCNKPYTIIADSDDSFDSNTLSDLSKEWKTLEEQKLNRSVASIWTLTKTPKGKIIGEQFPRDYWIVGFKERVLNHNIVGEKWASWDTNILKSHKMFSNPLVHIEESQTWNSINKDYDFLCLNLAHRNYFYSPDGLIASKKSRREVAMAEYLSSYCALNDVQNYEILQYKYYRIQAFNYFKSWIFYSDKHLKLRFSKLLICFLIFLFYIPKRLINKLI